ncbi:DNA repair protein RecN (Recombination protein N) [Dethiosulfatibacter aminovorans DSM 17477]|uniref:DNA repair protein RecN n=1 Tax=Dethiosulfatibacter aminovorans DSM 17477 TaxID=1121476 RepID=A0A1M6D9Q3_9FIRM|nr:DNA repair protein RecN [Dethiosulfatibacter aminovorans]SHI69880.1 DNA repair protein RecN (Recombination protein N) [Dethiosulfatibacter aminovorans DSM 17477]
MLLNLSVMNFIIFEKIFIDFTEGFNVFTGETGAGKSMIIDSLNLLLGGKSNKNFVRKGSSKAVVQGSFFVEENSPLVSLLSDNNIDVEDNTIIITREVHGNGRSTARINDIMINISYLKRISKHLLDIHGQYEQQSILNRDEHIVILDKMCGEEMSSVLREYSEKFSIYKNLKSELKTLEESSSDKYAKIDYLKYQIGEIEDASLKVGEDADLLEELSVLSNINDIKVGLNNSLNIISGEGDSVIENLSRSIGFLRKVSRFDPKIGEFDETLGIIMDNCQELSYDIISYLEEKDVDQERISYLTERLDLLNSLKRKYNMETDEILAFKEKAEGELLELLDLENAIAKKKADLDIIVAEMESLSDTMKAARNRKAASIEKLVENQLHSLNMKDARFKVEVDDTENFNSYGKNNVVFLISTNLGMELMELEKILSGGEVSRIMLAIKSIINEIDDIPTMIFDEIDSGISGRTAHLVGNKISKLSKTHQIICVTHSPQISSAADTHFRIEKKSDNDKTWSSVEKLNREERINEVARLLSGLDITENSVRNAEELIKTIK